VIDDVAVAVDVDDVAEFGDPVAADPVAADPVAVDPVAADPVAVDPVAVDPVAVDPVAVDPVAVDSAAMESVAAKGVTGECRATGSVTAAGDGWLLVFFSRPDDWADFALGWWIEASAVAISVRFSSSQILTIANSTSVRRCRT
jgi:hypothetical protein